MRQPRSSGAFDLLPRSTGRNLQRALPFLLSLCLSGASVGGTASGQADGPRRQFDFWVGEWDVQNRHLRAGSWTDGDLTRARITPVCGGVALLEEWAGPFFGGFQNGFSIRAWNAPLERWDLVLYWTQDGNADFGTLSGNFRHGRGEFFAGSATEQLRYTFSDGLPQTVRWDSARSQDGGVSWSTDWIMEFSRTRAASEISQSDLFNEPWNAGALAPRAEARALDWQVGRWTGEQTVEENGTSVTREVRMRCGLINKDTLLLEHTEARDVGAEEWEESLRVRGLESSRGDWATWAISEKDPVLRRFGRGGDPQSWTFVNESADLRVEETIVPEPDLSRMSVRTKCTNLKDGAVVWTRTAELAREGAVPEGLVEAFAQADPTPSLASAQALLGAKDFAGAARSLRTIVEQQPNNTQACYLLGYALHGAGDLSAAIEFHERATADPKLRSRASYNLACAYALQNEVDQSFEWLAKATEAGFSDAAVLATDTDLANLRSDPRFAAFSGSVSTVSFLEDFTVHYSIEGEAAGDRFGWIGRNAGDCDSDGVADLLISAPFKTLGSAANAGRIYVYSGADQRELYRRDGQAGDYLGIGIDGAGDVNGDGTPDQIAGASGARGRGAAFVYSGVDGEPLLELWGEAQGDGFGRKVAGCGDQDGDGFDDVIVGSPGYDGIGVDSGRAYVFSGQTGDVLWVLDGSAAGEAFGSCVDGHASESEQLLIVGAQHAGPNKGGRVYVYRTESGKPEEGFVIESQLGDVNLGRMFVSAVGDVNGDGAIDVYGSDWESNANGIQGAGRVYIHSGADGSKLYDLAGTNPGEGFGIGTCEAGDVNADGCDDFLVGIWQSKEGAPSGGKCVLYSGKDGAILQTYTCSTPGDTFGYDTTTLGDVNGDGLQDFLITSAASGISGPSSGRVFVVSAPDLTPAPTED